MLKRQQTALPFLLIRDSLYYGILHIFSLVILHQQSQQRAHQ